MSNNGRNHLASMNPISVVTAFGFIGASLIVSTHSSFASAIFDIDNSAMYTYPDGIPSTFYLKGGRAIELNDPDAKNIEAARIELTKEQKEVFSKQFDKLQDENGSSLSTLESIQLRLSRAGELGAEVKVSQSNFHEKCKDARDYQGCINSFSGNGSSSPGGISEYERSMIELRRLELERQRNQDRLDQMRYDLEQREKQIEADRRRRQDRFRAVQGWLDNLNPPSVTCTSMPNYFGGSSTTCR